VVPLVRQQHRELDLAADDAVHAAVRDADGAARRRGDAGRFGHLHIRQLQHRQVQAFGVIGRGESWRASQRHREDESSEESGLHK